MSLTTPSDPVQYDNLADDAPFAAPTPGEGSASGLLFRLVPALDSLRKYTAKDFGADLMAGLTVATVALPQSMAYALIAGIPPQYGLYTAIVMTAVGALFDSSRQLINGPTNAISIATFSALAAFSGEQHIEAAILLALMVGVVQVGITLLRLGDLTRYVSHAVIVGFTFGASILIVLDQLKNLLGLRSLGTGDDHFLKRFWLTMSQIEHASLPTIAVGLGTIAFAVALRALGKWLRIRLPEFLLAVIASAAIVWTLGLAEHGVKVIGTIPTALPAFRAPVIEWSWIHNLTGSALAIALLGLLEAIAMAKAIAVQTGQKLDMNQQCLSEGLANLAGSFFQCFPGSGSLTRSTVNQQSGARTQWSGVISAVAVAVTVLMFGQYARYIPQAGLAGILMITCWRMVDRQQLRHHLRTTRFDAWIVLVTAFSAVAVSVDFCILIGVFMSFVLYVPRAARVQITQLTLTPERVIRERVSEDEPCSRMLIYNLEGELFFGSAPNLEEDLASIEAQCDGQTRVVVLRLKRARNPDAVCLGIIDQFIRRLEARRVKVLICGVRYDLARIFHSSGLEERLGPQRIFHEATGIWSSTLEAVRHAYEILGRDTCETCPRRNETMNQEDWYYMI